MADQAKKTGRFLSVVMQVFVWTLVVLMVAGGVMYIQASRVPDNYKPVRLSLEDTKQATHAFVQNFAQEFGNQVKQIEPFEWSLTQKAANIYLASIDEIAFSLPSGVKRGYVNEQMAEMGLADPAIAFDDGKVTLMVRSTDYNKVISAEVEVKLTGDDKLQFTVSATRVGRLPVPSSILTDRLETLATKLSGKQSDDISKTLAELLAAINGEPISPPDTWRIQGIKVDIEAITIADGKLTLKVRPIAPPPRTKRK
ncbi:MAG: hypothetical protein HN350_06915 [Phycisphaerales bacterium]|jgi:hypothetical protein|nr:hypothetical protein [Phycisphaerales bacterium]